MFGATQNQLEHHVLDEEAYSCMNLVQLLRAAVRGRAGFEREAEHQRDAGDFGAAPAQAIAGGVERYYVRVEIDLPGGRQANDPARIDHLKRRNVDYEIDAPSQLALGSSPRGGVELDSARTAAL